MEIKDVIRTHRARLGLTEQELADRIGVTRGSVQQWESGATAPKRTNQDAVAAALGISKSELLGIPALVTSNIKFSVGEDAAPIVQALQSLDAHLHALSPILQDSGREVLRKWINGMAGIEEVSNALEAMALATDSISAKNTSFTQGKP